MSKKNKHYIVIHKETKQITGVFFLKPNEKATKLSEELEAVPVSWRLMVNAGNLSRKNGGCIKFEEGKVVVFTEEKERRKKMSNSSQVKKRVVEFYNKLQEAKAFEDEEEIQRLTIKHQESLKKYQRLNIK